MTEQQNEQLSSLLSAWRNHDDLRRSNASIAELAVARFQLDDSRMAAYTILR
jgi:hypothetical protein